MSKPTVAVNGACGRMGRLICDAVYSDDELEFVGAFESANNPNLGKDIGEILGRGHLGIPVSHDLPTHHIDAIIDFSVPDASVRIAKLCAEWEIALLVATTGHSETQREEIIACHHTTPLLFAPNTSLVVNLLMSLTQQAARVLKDKDFDVEIIERHHRFKADAPSGTAIRFAEIIEKEMGLTQRCYGRQGDTGMRPRNEIGLHAVRVGDNVGEHTIIFSTLGETMELVHKGHSRDSYVKGAIAAVKFLIAKKAGLYTMADVLGL